MSSFFSCVAINLLMYLCYFKTFHENHVNFIEFVYEYYPVCINTIKWKQYRSNPGRSGTSSIDPTSVTPLLLSAQVEIGYN